MPCLKCGNTTKDEQVFCPQCMAVMEDYPVKPDVHIQLPSRPKQDAAKKPGRRRRQISPEEQVAVLRRRQRRMAAIATAVILCLGVACALLAQKAFAPEDLEWGTNYTFDSPFN